MLVTLFGIVMEVREEQSEKALRPILVTLLGIVVFLQPAMRVLVAVLIIALQFSRLSYVEFLLSTTMEVKEEHPTKAPTTMRSTLFPMVTEVREEQPEKAPSPMLVTLLGIVTEVKEEQPEKALSPIHVTLLPMVTEIREEQSLKAPSPMLVTLFGMVMEVKEEQL